ncbi:MAG: hypothetical protein C0495_09150 [Acinetobacter sp.]|nr:hypothetical protein [Acinetobacter sp.]
MKPTVCILDIGLPGIDGYEMASLIKKQPHTNRTVLIAVTGYGQEKDKEEAYKAGFDLHFVKPVDHNLLSRAIEDLTENST